MDHDLPSQGFPEAIRSFRVNLLAGLWPLGTAEALGIADDIDRKIARDFRSGQSFSAILVKLGDPSALAAEFATKGISDGLRMAGLPGRDLIYTTPLPAPKMVLSESIQSESTRLRTTLLAGHHGVRLACAVTGCTATLAYFALVVQSLLPGVIHSALLPVLLFIISAQVASVAAYRALLRSEIPPWHVDLALIKFVLLSLVLLGFGVGIMFAVYWIISLDTVFIDVQKYSWAWFSAIFAIVAVTGALCAALNIMIQPWLVGIAVNRQILMYSAWKSRRSTRHPFVWFGAIGLSLILLSIILVPTLQSTSYHVIYLGVCAVGGIVTMVSFLIATLANAAAFRDILGESIPEPRQYSLLIPSAKLAIELEVGLRRAIAMREGLSEARRFSL